MAKMAKLFMTIAMLTNLTIVHQIHCLPGDVETKIQAGDVSIKNCGLTDDCDKTQLSQESYDEYFSTDKRTWGSLGLDPNLLHINQISLGFVPPYQDTKRPISPKDINDKLYKPMAIVGDYISLTYEDPHLKAIDWHWPIIQKLEGNPVWCIALIPTKGLDMVTEDLAHRIADKFRDLNKLGQRIWCRFAYEMNGNWNSYGMQPEKFKQKWNMLARIIKSKTDKTYMLWSPNAEYGNGIHEVRGGYTPYWPNADLVDIVGISFYHWGKGAKRINLAPTQDEAIGKLVAFSNIYGRGGWNKPVVVSETAAAYIYYQGTDKPLPGGAGEVEIKMTWLHLLMDRYIKELVPSLKAVIWFEVVKDENSTGNTEVHTVDFRLVTGNPAVAQAVRKLFANYDYKEREKTRKSRMVRRLH